MPGTSVSVQILVSVLLICLLDWNGFVKCHSSVTIPKLILVSMDGFRWDYLTKLPEKDVSNFTFLIRNGASASKGMKNVFATKTLPNHVTLVTGLYAESHGIVANEFYDPDFKEVYEINNPSQMVDSKWYDTGPEPIWVTNQKAGEERRSGSVFWPGCGAVQKGRLPSKYLLFDKRMDFNTRVDILVSWFVSKEPINLGLLYINEPDHTGHKYGPNSTNLVKKIKELDGVLGYLINKLKKHGIWDDINIIVTSDHGMTSTPAVKDINIDNYISPNKYRVWTGNPVALVLPNKNESQSDDEALKKVPHVTVYKKQDIPAYYHYKNSRRVTPILVVADPHYSLSFNKSVVNKTVGNHGYNNSFSDMHPIFMAHGPAFKNVTVEGFSNTDVYAMMAYVLNIPPAANNGSLSAVMALLKPRESSGGITVTYFVVIPIVLCVAALLSVAACRHRKSSHRL
ncbi:ectonucleotide pyrophosphatase/phosphodiesterase family member 5-like [Liolophura sinensis]|uniref:ectonucleotide pyrophosphatase/phosphodiesterase family member 5-like n=1 Tax=Liolophura sinensis TaxID=3198878 RepID=UPI003158A67C